MNEEFSRPDWAENSAWIRSVLLGMTRDPELAEDLAQDAVAAGLEMPASAVDNPRGWLRTVATRLVASHYRAEDRRRRRERRQSPRSTPSPDEIAERLDRQHAVSRVIRALPEPYRTVLVLRYYEEMSTKQIAVATGVPPTTVRTRITRAHRMVREGLAEEHGSNWAALFLPLTRAVLPPPHSFVGALGVAVAMAVAVAAWLLLPLADPSPEASASLPESTSLPADEAGATAAGTAPIDGVLREEQVAVLPPDDEPDPPQTVRASIYGRIVVPDPAEISPRARPRWAVRIRLVDAASSRDGGVWTTDQSTPTVQDTSHAPLGGGKPSSLPGEDGGLAHRLDSEGRFEISPLAPGRYDFILERDGIPVVLLYGIEARTDTVVDPRLEPLVVEERARCMVIHARSTTGVPVQVRPVFRYADGLVFPQRFFAGKDGRLELYCPAEATPEVILLSGACLPHLQPWRDDEFEVVLHPRYDVYLRAASPATIDGSVGLPYLVFRPEEPILGLPPSYFSTRIEMKPLAEGKTLRVPAYGPRPHALVQQTRAHIHGFPIPLRHYGHDIASGIAIDPASPLRPTVVALPAAFRNPPGAIGSQYTLLPDRVVDLDELRQAKRQDERK